MSLASNSIEVLWKLRSSWKCCSDKPKKQTTIASGDFNWTIVDNGNVALKLVLNIDFFFRAICFLDLRYASCETMQTPATNAEFWNWLGSWKKAGADLGGDSCFEKDTNYALHDLTDAQNQAPQPTPF